MKRKGTLLTVLTILILLNTTFVGGIVAGEGWFQGGFSPQKQGQCPYNMSNNPGIERWRVGGLDEDVGWFWASLVLDEEGTVYGTDMHYASDYNVYAIYPDGTVKWKNHVGQSTYATPIILQEEKLLVLADDNCRLYAFNLDTGQREWSIQLGFWPQGDIALDTTTRLIYIAGSSSTTNVRFKCYYPNGTMKWECTLNSDPYCDPVIGDTYVYIGDDSGRLHAIYKDNGTEAWQYNSHSAIKADIVLSNDGETIYFCNYHTPYRVYAVNAINGSLKWMYETAGFAYLVVDQHGIIYLLSSKLIALYPDGTKKYSVDDTDYFSSSGAISQDGILVGCCKYDLVAFDTTDGSILWEKKIGKGEHCICTPCISEDGTVYAGSTIQMSEPPYEWYGYIHAFGLQPDNEAPIITDVETPDIIRSKENNQYNILIDEPNLNPVYLTIDWGDGETMDWEGTWQGGYTPDIPQGFDHTYSKSGTYTIQVQARDTYGLESIVYTEDVEVVDAPILEIAVVGGIPLPGCYVVIRNKGDGTATNVYLTLTAVPHNPPEDWVNKEVMTKTRENLRGGTTWYAWFPLFGVGSLYSLNATVYEPQGSYSYWEKHLSNDFMFYFWMIAWW